MPAQALFLVFQKNIINHGDTEIAEKRIFCLSRKLSGQTKTISPFGVGSSSKERGAVGDWILSMPVPGPLNAELFDWGLPALKNKKFSVPCASVVNYECEAYLR